jgi:hypothetical protein
LWSVSIPSDSNLFTIYGVSCNHIQGLAWHSTSLKLDVVGSLTDTNPVLGLTVDCVGTAIDETIEGSLSSLEQIKVNISLNLYISDVLVLAGV